MTLGHSRSVRNPPDLPPPRRLVSQGVCRTSGVRVAGARRAGTRRAAVGSWLVRNQGQELVQKFLELVLTAASLVPDVLGQTVPQVWAGHLKALLP